MAKYCIGGWVEGSESGSLMSVDEIPDNWQWARRQIEQPDFCELRISKLLKDGGWGINVITSRQHKRPR